MNAPPSPTPLTDAAATMGYSSTFTPHTTEIVSARFARSLERQLSESQEKLREAEARELYWKQKTSNVDAALAAAVEREKTMAEALTAHNDNARSFFQIANRIATELDTHALGTNFGGFAETTHRMLTKYHQITNDARALAAPQEERGHG